MEPIKQAHRENHAAGKTKRQSIGSVFGVLLRFRKTISLFIIIIAFFVFYNVSLIDHTLETLKFSLEQTASAYDVADLNGIDLLLNQIMVNEIVPNSMNLENIINLEYARTAITSGKDYRVIDNVKISLDNVIKEREKNRNPFLLFIDSINRWFFQGFNYIMQAPEKISRRLIGKTKKGKIDTALFDKAQSFEKNGKMQEALICYEDFIKEYPLYEKIGVIKLRVANLYQRAGNREKAFSLYREVIRRYVGRREAYIARDLLFRLEQMEQPRKQEAILLDALSGIKEEDKVRRQNILYELGVLSLKTMGMEEAQKYFRRVIVLDPNSEIAAKARFNAAWISKEEVKMDESLTEFAKIAEEPRSHISLDSRYQIADIYHKEGKYQEAINVYMKLAQEYKNDPVSALCLFQAGASCTYDLNDDERAKDIFIRLQKEYPESPYAKFLSPGNPTGVFILYLVPRAARVVAWRVGGLAALSGYSGEIVKFRDEFPEVMFNQQFNRWLSKELPDTVGNLYVDIKGVEFRFREGKAIGQGRVTMGKFNVFGEAEGYLELLKGGGIGLIVTKAALERIPIPPVLINNALTGVSFIFRKHLPMVFTKARVSNGKVEIEGYGAKRMMTSFQAKAQGLVGNVAINDITDPKEAKDVYGMFAERFPESNFSANPKDDADSLFMDFSTRMFLYMGFKLLETTKDTKLDYERSVRTIGRLFVRHTKFRVSYTDESINAALNNLIRAEFPWIVNKEYLFDVKGVNVVFSENGDVLFRMGINVGRVGYPIQQERTKDLQIEGKFRLIVDSETKLPRIIFKDISVNRVPFPARKLNEVSSRCHDLLHNGRVPISTELIEVGPGRITIQGDGARDFISRVFNDNRLFVIFGVRPQDMGITGIERFSEKM